MKKWQILAKFNGKNLIPLLLANRQVKTRKEIKEFLNPPDPHLLKAESVGIQTSKLKEAISRIQKALKDKESIVVYADYDADGVTSGAIMWETLYSLGANVMPYIPHRVDEGYGLSTKGIDTVKEKFNPTLIITVDHGITAKEKVAYAKKLGIEVIVTDHHVKPKVIPHCLVVHTTQLSGAGVAWFICKELLKTNKSGTDSVRAELLALATIGTIADLIPLVGINRSLVKFGLTALNHTKRIGLESLIAEAGLVKGNLGTYEVSHILAPRLNAMGRLEHALEALRLLCTRKADKAKELAQKLGLTNRERQQLTEATKQHAGTLLPKTLKKLIFIAHESYNQGIIGLVAGRLTEEYYRPAIVVAKGEIYSKASARSISGFNIVEAIRSCSDLLVDVGGHPLAAGFTVETKNLPKLQERLEKLADKELDEAKLTRELRVDCELPLDSLNFNLWKELQGLAPFGFGNPEPVFAVYGAKVREARLVGAEGKHLRLVLAGKTNLPAIAFGFGGLYAKLHPDQLIDVAYTLDVDFWNGNQRLQLKIKDIQF